MTVRGLAVLFVASAILVCCESVFVDTLPKCLKSDYACQRRAMQLLFQNIGTTGIAAIDSFQIDPLDITGVHVPVFDLVDLTITKGNVKGIKDCKVTKFNTNFDNGQISSEAICDILMVTSYRASSYNPLIKIFLGTEAIHGEGNGHIKVDQLRMSADFPFDVVRRDNDQYIDAHLENAQFNFDVLGKVEFHAEKCNENDQSSEILISILNNNWKLVTNFVLRIVRDTASGIIADVGRQFFDNIPLKHLITDQYSSRVYV